MTRRCLAVIPARGGSKGLAGKNVRQLRGLPLIAHSIRCAEMAVAITRTVVSTDSEEIMAVAREHGGDVPFRRPSELAQDDTPMMPVICHAVEEIERQEGVSYDFVLLLDPTSPCRTPGDIGEAMKMLLVDSEADGVVACSQPDFNPFWVGVTPDESGAMRPAFPQSIAYGRRQDVPPFFRINGALYLWRRDFVQKHDSATAGRQLLFEIPERRAFSIDNLSEFEQLSALLEAGIVQFPWIESQG